MLEIADDFGFLSGYNSMDNLQKRAADLSLKYEIYLNIVDFYSEIIDFKFRAFHFYPIYIKHTFRFIRINPLLSCTR